jgi:hypothetical protein
VFASWTKYITIEQKLVQMGKTDINYASVQASLDAFVSSITSETYAFVLDIRHLTYLSFAVLCFALQHIPEIIYISIKKRQFNPFNFIGIWDLICFCVFLTFIVFNYAVMFRHTWKERTFLGQEDRSLMFMKNMANGGKVLLGVEVFLIVIMVFLMWIRAIFLLRYNQYLGKLTGVVQTMLVDIAVYFAYFLLEILFWALLLQLATVANMHDMSLSECYTLLFYAAFGQFDFAILSNFDSFGYYFATGFFVIYLIVNIGLFLSLFNSMVVKLYEEFFKNEEIYHIMETLKIRPQTQADKEYSALISLPPPLNVFLFFLAPFLLTSKNPEIWNKVILWVAYLPILVLATTVFFVYNVLLLPLAYVKLFFHKLVMIFVYSKSYRVSKANKFILTVIFIPVGPIRLICNVVVDTIAFVSHCLQT